MENKKDKHNHDISKYRELLKKSSKCPLSNEGSRMMGQFLDCVVKANGLNLVTRIQRGPESYASWVFTPLKEYTDGRRTAFAFSETFDLSPELLTDIPIMLYFVDKVSVTLKRDYMFVRDTDTHPEAWISKLEVCTSLTEQLIKRRS